jgi:glyoxylase-like metal-dependent hydrolase (beta-lactamase superfamily II)
MGAPAIPTQSLPLAGGSAGAGVRVHPLRTATSLAPPAFFDRPKPFGKVRAVLTPRSRWLRLPFPAYLVEHPTAGRLLLDTGMHASVAENPFRSLGLLAIIVVGREMEEADAVPAQLAARGIDPSEVGTVVMTHLHYDHASGATQFPGATFLVERREWQEANKPLGFRNGYTRKQLDRALDWRTIDVDDEADLLGDGSIRIFHTPGHTAGHLSFLLRLQSGETLLITADAALARRTLEQRLLPLLLEDDLEYWRSLDRLITLAGTADHVITGHDPEGLPRHDGVFA